MKHIFQFLRESVDFSSSFLYLCGSIFSLCWKKPIYYHLIIKNIYDFGYRSLFIIISFAISVGVVVTLHIGLSIEKYGAKLYVSKIIILSLFSEIGTVVIAIILAGKIGAGITSEIASMKITEQLDALRALGVSPIKRVIIPKAIACIITIPLLCIICNGIALLTSAYTGKIELQLDVIDFLARALQTPPLIFFIFSVFKTMIFALFISITSCHYGLNITQSSYKVGRNTMKAFVVSFMLIIFGDIILTKIYYNFLHPG